MSGLSVCVFTSGARVSLVKRKRGPGKTSRARGPPTSSLTSLFPSVSKDTLHLVTCCCPSEMLTQRWLFCMVTLLSLVPKTSFLWAVLERCRQWLSCFACITLVRVTDRDAFYSPPPPQSWLSFSKEIIPKKYRWSMLGKGACRNGVRGFRECCRRGASPAISHFWANHTTQIAAWKTSCPSSLAKMFAQCPF